MKRFIKKYFSIRTVSLLINLTFIYTNLVLPISLYSKVYAEDLPATEQTQEVVEPVKAIEKIEEPAVVTEKVSEPVVATAETVIAPAEVTPIIVEPVIEPTPVPTTEPTPKPTPAPVPTEEPAVIPTVTPEPTPTPTIEQGQILDGVSTIATQSLLHWTFENVELGKEYVDPQNSGVRLTFTKLPNPAGNIKIEEITLTKEQIKQTGSLSDKAYDITSDMKDGDFSYNLSLPIPDSSKGKAVEVKFAEELSNIGSAEKVENDLTKTDTSVSVESLNHFTIFIITDDSATYSGTWIDYASQGYSEDGVHYPATVPADQTATWTFSSLAPAGSYKVYVSWSTHSNRTQVVPYVLNYNGGSTSTEINQEQLADQTTTGGSLQWSGWFYLGTRDLNTSSNLVLTSVNNASGTDYVIADEVLLAPNTAPTTVWIDDNYTINSKNDGHVWGYDAFTNIQDGVTAVVSGGTVNVAAGTYTENVTINKALTLVGVGKGTDPASNTILTQATSGSGITITASDVTVSYLRIKDYTIGGTSDHGVKITGDRSNIMLDHIAVTNTAAGVGMESGAMTNITVQYSDLLNNRSAGLYVYFPAYVDGLTIDHSDIENNAHEGIFLYREEFANAATSTNVHITNSTVSHNAVNGDLGDIGEGNITLYGFNGNLEMSHVIVDATGADYGIALTGTYDTVGPAGTVSLTDVSVTGTPVNKGIYISWYTEIQNLTFTDVTVNVNLSTGLSEGGRPRAAILMRHVGNTYGINLGNTVLAGTRGTGTNHPYDLVASAANVGATGVTFTQTDPFAIEDVMLHQLDANVFGGGADPTGLVTWNANNLYVTQDSGSIQRGIDAATSGDTVNVAAGAYDEQVVIDGKNLTLQGAGDTTIIRPSAPAKLSSLYTYPAGTFWAGTVLASAILVENSASVTVKDLKVDGVNITTTPAGASRVAGILYGESAGTIDNATVTTMVVDAYVTRSYGIDLSAVGTARNVEVKNSDITDWSRNGIQAQGASLTANIHDNILTGPGDTLVAGAVPNGILFIHGADGNATSNTISALHTSVSDSRSAGILFFDPLTAGIVVENNNISNVDDGVDVSHNANGVIIRNNTLHNNLETGIHLEDGATGTTITGNIITDNAMAGIRFAGAADPGTPDDPPGTGNVANFKNTITGNTIGVVNYDTQVFDVTNNWWGSASGPYDNKTLVGTPNYNNPSGTGNSVSSYVDYKPWYKDAAMTTLSNVAPAIPSLVSPTNGSVQKPTSLILDWSDITDLSTPVTYVYQASFSSAVGANNALASPIYTSGTLSVSEIDASGTGDGTYYWQARACDGLSNCSDWSGPWAVTVDSVFPGLSFTDNVIHGPAQSDSVAVTVSDINSNSSTYEYGFSPDNVCNASDTFGNTFTSGTPFNFSTQTHNGSYICVRASDLAGNISYLSSTNSLNIDVTGPTIPGQIGWSTENPPAGNDYINGTDFNNYKTCGQSLNYSPMTNLWSPSTDTNAGVAGYDREVYSPNSTTLLVSHSLSTSYVNGGGATNGNTYWTRIRAYDALGNKGAWTSLCAITYDTTAPIVAEVTPVSTPASNLTPSYTFNSSEAGSISYSGDCNSATTSAISGSNTVAFNTLADGTHSNCTITVTDSAGNPSNVLGVSSFVVDSTAPAVGTVTLTTDTGTYVRGNGAGFNINATITDTSGSGIASCFYTLNDGASWLPATYSGTTCSKTGATATNGTVLSINVKGVDNATNQGSGTALTRTADSANPAVSGVTVTPTFGSYTNGTPAISATITDSVSPINLCQYRVRTTTGPGSWSAWATATFVGSTCSKTVIGLTDGTSYDFQIRGRDSVNHYGNSSIFARTVDITNPVVDAGTDKTINATYTQNATVSDAASGIATYAWTKEAGPGTVTFGSSSAEDTTVSADTDGTYTLRLTVTDKVGNSAFDEITLVWDTAAPVTTDSGTDANWHNIDVTVALNCDDGTGSGCKTTYYTTDGTAPTTASLQGNSVVVSNEGITTIEYFSVDNAGNGETVKTAAHTVKIDKTNPASIITTFGLANGGSIETPTWDGSVAGTASDVLSSVNFVKLEIARTLFDSGAVKEYWNSVTSTWQSASSMFNATGSTSWNYQLPTPAEGTYQVTSHAVDNAGNEETTYSITIIYDKTIPEVTLAIDPTSPDGINNWYKTNPTITLTANDNYNVARIEYQLDSTGGTWETYTAPIQLDEGTWKFYYRSVDNAENISGVGLKNVKVDTSDPSSVSSVTATYNESENTITLNWSANDSDINEVRVYKGTTSGFGVDFLNRISTQSASDEDYTDHGALSISIARGNTYYYKLVAIDDAGNRSNTKAVSIEIPTLLAGGAPIVTVVEQPTELSAVLGANTEETTPSAGGPADSTTPSTDNPVLGAGTQRGGLSWWWILLPFGLILGPVGYWFVSKGKRKY